MGGLVVRGATILTMNDAFDIVEGDLLVRDGRIAAELIAVRRGKAEALKAASLQWMPNLKALR